MNTKEKLIAAARELIYRQGYNNTSIRDILLAANAGKGQLYYYFDSKKSIGLAVIKENIAIWQKELFEGILAPSSQPEKDFAEMLTWIFSFHQKQQHYYGCPMGNLIVELSLEDEDFRILLNDFMQQWLVALANKIKVLRSIDLAVAKIAAQKVIAQIQGSILLLKVTQDLTILESNLLELKKHYIKAN